MASQLWFSLMVLVSYELLHCSSAAVHQHTHTVDTGERESDGSFRARNAEHYDDQERHNVEFDHEAIIGSVKEADEFDKLSPEESRAKLEQMLPKMDLNGDKFVDREELKKWIVKSFENLSKEEALERMKDSDTNDDQMLTWNEYMQDTFGVDTDEELSSDEMGGSGMLVSEERAMWKMADKNNDGVLDLQEFEIFSNPEEHPEMHSFLVNQTLREKDVDRDGFIDFQEYVGERALHQDRAWLIAERERFDADLDLNKDGRLDFVEIKHWIIPNNEEIAEEEVDHLFASSDDDHDDLLSFDEILDHTDTFVGSEATSDINDIMSQHFDDEL